MLTSIQLFILIAFVLFVIGLGIGLLFSKNGLDFDKPGVRLVIGALVSVMWALSIVAEIIIPAYTVSILIHGIMGAVVGYLFSDDGITFNIGSQK